MPWQVQLGLYPAVLWVLWQGMGRGVGKPCVFVVVIVIVVVVFVFTLLGSHVGTDSRLYAQVL